MKILTAILLVFSFSSFADNVQTGPFKRTLDQIENVFSSLKNPYTFDQEVTDLLTIKAQRLKNENGNYHSTPKGRQLYYLYFPAKEVTENTTTVFYLGGIHADEFTPSLISWRFISDILRNETLLPREHNVIFVPMLNMDGWIDGFLKTGYPTRKNINKVDLNRAFYDREDLPNYRSQKETEFVMDIIDKFKPEYWIIPHSTLNILDLDGSKEQKYKRWIEEVYQATIGANAGAIPIEDFGTYAPPRLRKNWSIGKLATEMHRKNHQVSSLTYEFGGPGEYPRANDPQRWLKISKRKHLGRYKDNTHLADGYYRDYFQSLLVALTNLN